MFYNYDRAKERVEENTKLAELGDSDAQFYLGSYYCTGYYVERNIKLALKWWNLAAKQGNKKAQHQIGLCYYKGIGVKKDYNKAVKCFILAGELAADVLGECYLRGYGVEKGIKKAIDLWECIAQGRYYMYMKLAHLYSDGIEMEPNYQRAVYWWNKAAFGNDNDPNGGIAEARYELARCFYEGKGVNKNINLALKYFSQTIDVFLNEEGESQISQEPEYIINSRSLLLKHGDKNMINIIKKAAQNGDQKACEILKESKAAAKKEKREKKSSPKNIKPKTIPPLKLSIGEKIQHKSYGQGVICEIDNQYIYVDFEKVGKKSFLNPKAFLDGFLVAEKD